MIDTRFQTAFQIILFIAFNDERGKRSTSGELAAAVGSNASYVRGMLGPLIRRGILRSFSGKGGGWVLARPPAEISLSEIYGSITSAPVIWATRKQSVLEDRSASTLFSVLQVKAEKAVLESLRDKSIASSMLELKAMGTVPLISNNEPRLNEKRRRS